MLQPGEQVEWPCVQEETVVKCRSGGILLCLPVTFRIVAEGQVRVEERTKATITFSHVPALLTCTSEILVSEMEKKGRNQGFQQSELEYKNILTLSILTFNLVNHM